MREYEQKLIEEEHELLIRLEAAVTKVENDYEAGLITDEELQEKCDVLDKAAAEIAAIMGRGQEHETI